MKAPYRQQEENDLKLLLCDDNEDILDTLQESFKDKYSCKTAKSGQEASELLAKEEFDLVITDINMPNGGGERVLTELSARDSIKVYVYSGNINPQVRKFYSKLGASGVYAKPEGFDSLFLEVNMSPAVKSKLAG